MEQRPRPSAPSLCSGRQPSVRCWAYVPTIFPRVPHASDLELLDMFMIPHSPVRVGLHFSWAALEDLRVQVFTRVGKRKWRWLQVQPRDGAWRRHMLLPSPEATEELPTNPFYAVRHPARLPEHYQHDFFHEGTTCLPKLPETQLCM